MIKMEYRYRPSGVCSSEMIFDIDESTHIINELKVLNGCNGNLKAISKLVEGMEVEKVLSILKALACCADSRIPACNFSLMR